MNLLLNLSSPYDRINRTDRQILFNQLLTRKKFQFFQIVSREKEMAAQSANPVEIDLNEFKLHADLRGKSALTLHFNTPSRRFYLSLITLVVMEMKKRDKIVPIPLAEHWDLLALLNETVGGAAGSSEKQNLPPRIYRKWKHALTNLEEAPLFKVLGRKQEYDGLNGKSYAVTETEKDLWANLFQYIGSGENIRVKFALDKIGADLDDVVITYGDLLGPAAWESFLSCLRRKDNNPAAEPVPMVMETEDGGQTTEINDYRSETGCRGGEENTGGVAGHSQANPSCLGFSLNHFTRKPIAAIQYRRPASLLSSVRRKIAVRFP
jgi:hypothetical protein